MIIEVPFVYVAEFVPARHRNEQRRCVRDAVPVEIAEASSADTPIVLRSTHDSCGTRRSKPTDYRTRAGRLWVPSLTEKGSRPITGPGLAASATAADRWRSPFTHDEYGQFDQGRTVEEIGGGRFIEGHEASRQARIDVVAHEAADLLLIDGALWKSTSEPVYFIDRFHTFGTGTVWSIEVTDAADVKPKFGPERYFRADRFEEAVAALAECKKSELARSRSARSKRLIEVLRPDLLGFRYDMKPRIDMVAERALEDVKNDLADADVAFFVAYARLRDALRTTPRDHAAIADIVSNELGPLLDGRAVWQQEIDALHAEWLACADTNTVPADELAEFAPTAAV